MEKKKHDMLRNIYLSLIPVAVGFALCCLFAVVYDTNPVLICFTVLAIIAAAVSWFLLKRECKKLQTSIDSLFYENDSAAGTIFESVTQPCAVCTTQGQVISKNESFAQLCSDMYLNKLFSADELSFDNHSFEKELGGKHFIVHVIPIKRKNKYSRDVLYIYMNDISLQVKFQKMYNDTKPVVAKVYVDNYDNMSVENDMYSNTVLNNIEEKLLHFTRDTLGGIYRREIRSFLIVFEARSLKKFEDNISKFLNEIHDIKTEDGKSVTLSVGVGCEETVYDAAELSSQAMEMALGRGGDQAVLWRSKNDSPKYFGDGKNSPEQTNSRVHVRSFANYLHELILGASDIYVMGHRDEDVDCIGSGLALVSFIQRKLSKRALFVCSGGRAGLEKNINTSLPDTLQNCILSTDDIPSYTKQNSLLIIVDAQREKILSSPELYRLLASNAVVIDHHRRSEDSLSGLKASLLESAVSSTCEMVTEVLQTLSEQKRPIPKFESTALFAGIAMDTKGFVFNTGKRTFEAAALLKKCGADTTAAMMMYQDDRERYVAIANLVESAQMYSNNIAISVGIKEINDSRAVIARAADALVSLKGIVASVVLVKSGNNVVISARSTGEINVQLICEALGGGGHRTVAGAQLAGVSCDEALEEVKSAINSYFADKEKNDEGEKK